MTSPFNAKAPVLRCSRCGTFVDWSDARAQVICECRPRIELPPVLVREAADGEREMALDAVAKHSKSASLVGFAGIPIRDEVRLEKMIA